MTHLDTVGRKIKDPIDYLVEASRKSRKMGVALTLGGYTDLASEADKLNAKIQQKLMDSSLEDWETGGI